MKEEIGVNCIVRYGRKILKIENSHEFQPKEIMEKIRDFLFDCIGGKTYQVDIGDNRCPEYITKERTLKNRHWRTIEIGLLEKQSDRIKYVGFGQFANAEAAIKEFIELNVTSKLDNKIYAKTVL